MLLSPFGSPRRLAVLTVLVFLAIVVLVRNSTYSEYLPKYDLPTFGNAKVPQDISTGSSSFKEGSALSEPWQEYKSEQDKVHAAPPPPKEEEYEEKVEITSLPTSASHSSTTSTSSKSVSTSASKTSSSAKITPFVHATYKELQAKIKEFIQWDRPDKGGHWPGYGDYVDKDYDPNRWEGLPMYAAKVDINHALTNSHPGTSIITQPTASSSSRNWA
jgi:hypothetical protein